MRSEGSDSEEQLRSLVAEAGIGPLSSEQLDRFAIYLSLFVRWNTRINLSSVRDPHAILSRHFVESIACTCALPIGITSLLDFGSGGGLPGIPIAICRPEIAVTLAESHGKKAAFLHEAVRELGLAASVFDGRAETLAARFDCVTLRAVDKMAKGVAFAGQLVNADGWLALMTTHADTPALQSAAGDRFEWSPAVTLPRSDDRVLVMGKRTS